MLVLRDQIGSFLQASRMFAERGVNIRRVSYNRVIDPSTCFIEAEGPEPALSAVDADLSSIGVLPGQQQLGQVELLEFTLDNRPGVMIPLLELVQSFGLNITYYDAKTAGPQNRSVRMGLYIERPQDLEAFEEAAGKLCPVRRIPYDKNQHIIDNNLFYLSFAREMTDRLGLDARQEHSILVNSNRIIQFLENTNADPFRPFEYLRQFSLGIYEFRGKAYREATRVTPFTTVAGAHGWCIEPPAGSDTWVLECEDRLLCIDSGYRIYRSELLDLLHELFPDWDQRRKELFLTHADIDHVGACDLFDRVYAIGHVLDNFRQEHLGRPNAREVEEHARAYNRIGMILSAYESPWLENFVCIGRRPANSQEPIARCYNLDGSIATLKIPPFEFEVWEGAGGHVCGETVLIDRAQHVCVSGDIFVNVHGETKQQSRFNSLAPFLMTSVDTKPDLARKERVYLFGLLDPGPWQLLVGHGGLNRYEKR